MLGLQPNMMLNTRYYIRFYWFTHIDDIIIFYHCRQICCFNMNPIQPLFCHHTTLHSAFTSSRETCFGWGAISNPSPSIRRKMGRADILNKAHGTTLWFDGTIIRTSLLNTKRNHIYKKKIKMHESVDSRQITQCTFSVFFFSFFVSFCSCGKEIYIFLKWIK